MGCGEGETNHLQVDVADDRMDTCCWTLPDAEDHRGSTLNFRTKFGFQLGI